MGGEYIYGIFSTVWYVILCEIFTETFVGKSVRKKWNYIWIVIWCILNYGITIILKKQLFLKSLIVILIGSIVLYLYFKQDYIKMLVLACLYQGCNFVVDYTVLNLMIKIFPTLIQQTLSETLIASMLGLVSQVIIFCFVMALRKFFLKEWGEVLSSKDWMYFSIFPFFTIISITLIVMNFEIIQNRKQGNVLLCIALGLVVMNLLVFYLIRGILEREKQIQEDKLFKARVENETKMYHSISENYDKQCKREHEYKNQLSCIVALTREGKIQELSRYIEKFDQEINNKINSIDTNNVIVNAILNSKYQETRRKNILFIVKINDLSELHIEDEDIVVILSNLLNNAIEACEQCEKKYIKLKFIQNEKETIISVANSHNNNFRMQDGKYQTSKVVVGEKHGIGIENIKETVEKYKGDCVIRHNDKEFCFSILIKNEESNYIK
ncbi:MAG: GHKL domain-containing protein [Lachnospiraceae bacterium]|nr:GHKL domain-containing protein [Lachnospiraceae bacterium]